MHSLSTPFLLLILLSPVAPAWCHGVEGQVTQARGYQVTARYDDGEPMIYATVEIRAAGEPIAFQSGRTDRNGLMLFLPDRPGVWEAVITDGMGHRLVLAVTVPEADEAAAAPSAAPATATPTSRVPSVIAGLTSIFGLFGFFYGYKARRTLGRTPPRG